MLKPDGGFGNCKFDGNSILKVVFIGNMAHVLFSGTKLIGKVHG